jgi:hypothetical protein
MEIEELLLLSGCCLDQQENVVVEGAGDAASWRILVPLKQLDGFDAVFTGDAGGCSGANHMETDQHERCVA